MTTTASPAPGPAGPTAATRYLCAAAHLLPRFADDVLERTLAARRRAVAPSPGVDLGPVLQHCLLARRRRILRDAALLGLLLAVVVALGALQLGAAASLVLLAWFAVLTEAAVARYDVLGRLRPGAPGAGGPGAADAGPPLSPSVRSHADRQARNVVVYSGFSPFSGSGFEVAAWSFALNVRRGAEGLDGRRRTPQDFGLPELYQATADRLAALGIDGLVLEDRLHVQGRDARAVDWLLPDPGGPPLASVPPEVVERHRGTSSQLVRHYLTARVVDWGGELVLSVFLRYRRVAEDLFVESSQFLLPPLAEPLHRVDDDSAVPRAREVLALGASSALRTPVLLLGSPGALLRRALEPLRRALRDRRERRLLAAGEAFDHGAPQSIREAWSAADYRRYFQKLDKEMYAKLVERTTLEALTDFLDARGVDTSALDERRSTILNTGVMVTGGAFSAGTVAAGTRARASTTSGRVPRQRREARRAGTPA